MRIFYFVKNLCKEAAEIFNFQTESLISQSFFNTDYSDFTDLRINREFNGLVR